ISNRKSKIENAKIRTNPQQTGPIPSNPDQKCNSGKHVPFVSFVPLCKKAESHPCLSVSPTTNRDVIVSFGGTDWWRTWEVNSAVSLFGCWMVALGIFISSVRPEFRNFFAYFAYFAVYDLSL